MPRIMFEEHHASPPLFVQRSDYHGEQQDGEDRNERELGRWTRQKRNRQQHNKCGAIGCLDNEYAYIHLEGLVPFR
jgi:hypothetical protein